jgi:serine protease Do
MRLAVPHRHQLLVSSALLTALMTLSPATRATPDAAATPSASSSGNAVAQAVDLSTAFKTISREVAPSVVHITSIEHIEPTASRENQEDLLRQFFFRRGFPDFWGSPFEFTPPETGAQPERRGEGSGVIVRKDGYIITNNHVVAGADELLVRLNDDRELKAEVVGTDPDSDIAVLKVDADKLVPARLGDSTAIEVGDWVVAVGDPFGLDHTVTAGIISAKGRGNMGLATFENFIQTDAAINPGNSGGPLVDMQGEVIGINTAITTRTGGSLGIGFAIPSNMVHVVLDGILQHGKVERGWLGIVIQPLTPDLAESFGYKGHEGALIGEVINGGPAEKAGLEAGDIVVKFDGKPVDSSNDLLLAVASDPPNKKISLEAFRNGETRRFDVKLGQRPSPEQMRTGTYRPEPTPSLGMIVEDLTPELAARLNLEDQTGVVVAQVQPGSPAAEAGLQPGDVIEEVGHTPVSSVQEYEKAMSDLAKSASIRLRVSTDNASRFVILKPAGE